MIVTLTPNPSLDRTLEIATLDRGGLVRATASTAEAGGKGVNVARALAANAVGTRAVLPVGGPEGDHLASLLDALGIEAELVAATEPVRTNISLVEPDGTVTKVNASGPTLGDREIDALQKATVTAEDATMIAACGSLPPGVPEDFYARLTGLVHDRGIRIAVDTSDAPLRASIGAAPDVLKPNEHELAEATGASIRTFGDVVASAQQLRARGVAAVLVSLGRHGAVLVDGDTPVHADTAPVAPKSNVGAGDATLAGFLAAGGAGPEALRQAVAWGAAAVQLPGTAMPAPADIDLDAVRLHDLDPDRRLTREGN